MQEKSEHCCEYFSCQLIGYGNDGAEFRKEESHTSQENDRRLGPMHGEMDEKSKIRPSWQTVSPYSGITKAYWLQ